MTALDPLFNPRGIAIIGASPNLGRGGGQALHALLEQGYAGALYPVNPRYGQIGKLRCYPSVLDIEGDCDVAIIALPAVAVPAVISECGEAGIRFAVVHSSGFRETGEAGNALERELLANARAAGVRIVGPNCLGVINVPNNVYAAFGSMIRAPFMIPGAVSMVSQSGAYGHSMALYCRQAGVGFRYMMAIGNETDLATTEVLDFYLDDPATRIVLTYVEGVADGRRLMEIGRKAARIGKPVLLWKGGQGEEGLRAVASHTANMTSSYDVFSAALRQCGIIEITELEDIPDLIHALDSGKLPRGRRAAVIGGSGGAAIVFVDAAERAGVAIPRLGRHTTELIRSCIPPAGSPANPVDFTASFLNDDTTANFARAMDGLVADDDIDQILVILSTVQGKRAFNGAQVLGEVAARSAKPIFVFSAVPPEFMAEAMEAFQRAKIPVLRSPARIARIAGILCTYAERLWGLQSAAEVPPPERLRSYLGDELATLDERESKQLLQQHGIPTVPELFLKSGETPSPHSVTYPVAAKVVSRDLPHKSDVGGVVLGIRSDAELSQAVALIRRNVALNAPDAVVAGITVSPMVENATETILGISTDGVFGPVILFGLGGTFTEVMHDVAFRVAPFDENTAGEMIRELRASKVFDGVRGARPRDTEALRQILSKLSRMAWSLRDHLKELDINPLFVREVGAGVVAADALAVVRKA